MISLTPITAEHYIQFFGVKPERTIRGYAFWIDGEVKAIFGALLGKEATMLFSDMKDDIKLPAITIWRWAKTALEQIDDMKQPLYATSEKSGKFLLSLGFEHMGGKTYRYVGGK